MAPALKKLEKEALKLPARSRARLAKKLITSLDGPPDPDATKLWIVEAQRRADELASGKVKGIPAHKALQKALSAIR